MNDLTPDESIRKHFGSAIMAALGRQFNVSYEVEKVEVLGEFAHRRGNYRIHFKGGEVSDWNIQFDQDNGEILDAYCFNDVI